MRTFMVSKTIVHIFLLILLICGMSERVYADVITGTITNIDGTRVTVQSDDEELTIIISNIEGIAVGNYVRVIYQSVADLKNVFVSEEIEVLQD
ncbi:MAG: hypothetical protein LWX08_15715 [Deltaproteobacteria bacterium]|jgi:hypothetical protein|nr:hypothetical protein [Deltaproteobacteria bacterium]